ncbi:MAG: AAA family ATPase [Gammaproteobacteria bacterium]|nr:AAA family ATPase [Gammaproteobacteria bacterium]MDE0442792.1 AAA family ATPase [Gammaproteobacteria bacterium]
MLKRLYADNFRCLENFEIRFGESNLLLGRNGTGKTSVFDVLRKIQDLVVRGLKVDQVFPAYDLSANHLRNEQRFEIDTQSEDDSYSYVLVIEHTVARDKMKVLHEALKHNEHPVFEFNDGDARLYRDDYTEGPLVPFDWGQSGVGFLNERSDNQKLTRFKKDAANFVIASPCPPIMATETRTEDEYLDPLMRNFVGWYRRAAQENMGSIGRLFNALQDVLPGFESVNLTEAGENSRALKVVLSTPSGTRANHSFDQLSDGQRVLIALYSLLHLSSGRRVSMFLDEPDNYLTLSEVQPWLAEAVQSCGDSIDQLVVASHHPHTIDYMAGASGLWFSREETGPARVSERPANTVDGLSISETVARGWE